MINIISADYFLFQVRLAPPRCQKLLKAWPCTVLSIFSHLKVFEFEDRLGIYRRQAIAGEQHQQYSRNKSTVFSGLTELSSRHSDVCVI